MRTNVGFSHTLSITYYIRLCTVQIKLGIAFVCSSSLDSDYTNRHHAALIPAVDGASNKCERISSSL